MFIDELGDFGEYEDHSPFHILIMVFRNQEYSIGAELEKLE